ncbi:MAG: tetratricopeptide repeat protein [Saprospiraceae bacterium]
MAKRKVSPTVEETPVQEVFSPTQDFIQKYQTPLLYVLGGLVVLGLGYWGYKAVVVAPKQQEAVAAMWHAQALFEQDSFKMALENPGGGFDGFQTLADKYSGTPAGSTASYCAGICFLQMGDFDNAIKYLDDSSPDGMVLPAMRFGALGDAYSEKKDYSSALKYYDKAVGASDNEILAAYYLKKLAMLNEHEGNKDAALKAFERIRTDYPNQSSQDWREVEKYIYRLQAKQ